MPIKINSRPDLKTFCEGLIKKYGDPGSITEETKAAEFYRSYLAGRPVIL